MCDCNPISLQNQVMSPRAAGLCYAARPIDAGTLARLRVHAYETGRVIERDGLMVLGFGTAAALRLSGGLANPLSLGRAVAELRAIPLVTESPSVEVADEVGDSPDAEPVPIAIGALRFDRCADGELVVPQVTAIARAGRNPSVVVVASQIVSVSC